MKCCICGKEIEGYGNNPYPLCGSEDYESKCCTDCDNQYVIQARLMEMKLSRKEIEKGDLVVIFWAKDSDSPIRTLVDNGKFLAGYAEENEELPEGCWEGTWGGFLLNTNTDSFMVVEDN